MSSSPSAEPGDRPGTATAATLARLRRRLPRTLSFMVVLCLAIASLLAAFDHASIGSKLVYSFTIGFTCWSLTDLSRLLAAALTDRFRRWRGWPASPSGFDSGWRGIVGAMLVAMLVGPPLGLAIADRLTGSNSPSLFRLDATNTRVTVALTVVASLASVVVLSLMERLATARAQAEAAQRLAAEHQLRLLQSQLEPHMLFNTLANLRVLIGMDPPRAQAMLDHMIRFLRATLNASRASTHTLAAEFDRLADYLALMGVRMGPRLQVQLDLPAALAALPVPPLLLQPLVENAIQHGLEHQVAGGSIAVHARRDGDSLLLTVRDTGVGLAAAGSARAGGGFGLTQVRERLAALYGQRAGLTLAADADGVGTLARLHLPIGFPSPGDRTRNDP